MKLAEFYAKHMPAHYHPQIYSGIEQVAIWVIDAIAAAGSTGVGVGEIVYGCTQVGMQIDDAETMLDGMETAGFIYRRNCRFFLLDPNARAQWQNS